MLPSLILLWPGQLMVIYNTYLFMAIREDSSNIISTRGSRSTNNRPLSL